MFQSFGHIDEVQERQYNDTDEKHYFVRYGNENDAERALANEWEEMFVSAADLLHQPDHPLQNPPDQDSPANILNALNNDCFKAVFEH